MAPPGPSRVRCRLPRAGFDPAGCEWTNPSRKDPPGGSQSVLNRRFGSRVSGVKIAASRAAAASCVERVLPGETSLEQYS